MRKARLVRRGRSRPAREALETWCARPGWLSLEGPCQGAQEGRLVVTGPLFSQQPRKLWVLPMVVLGKQGSGAARGQDPRQDQMSTCCGLQWPGRGQREERGLPLSGSGECIEAVSPASEVPPGPQAAPPRGHIRSLAHLDEAWVPSPRPCTPLPLRLLPASPMLGDTHLTGGVGGPLAFSGAQDNWHHPENPTVLSGGLGE